MEAIWLLFGCGLMLAVGFVAQNSAVKHRAQLEEEKRSRALDRITQRLDRLLDDEPPGDICRDYFNECIDELLEARQRLDWDLAEELARNLIEFHNAGGKYIQASHPPMLRLKFPLIEAEVPVVEVNSKDANSCVVYNVDVRNRTCTCDSCNGLSDDIPLDDARRVCRHQIEVIDGFDAMPELDSQTEAVVSNPFREPFYTELNDDEMHAIVGYHIPIRWVRIWVLKPKKNAGTYSYNVKENRWAYGEAPVGIANKIKANMRRSFGVV